MAIVLAFMAGPMELDTGQFFTYLFIYALPHIIVELTRQAIPKDRAFYKTLLLRQAWLPQGHCRLVPRKKVKRYKKKPASIVPEGVNTANKLRTYLLPLAMAFFPGWLLCGVTPASTLPSHASSSSLEGAPKS